MQTTKTRLEAEQVLPITLSAVMSIGRSEQLVSVFLQKTHPSRLTVDAEQSIVSSHANWSYTNSGSGFLLKIAQKCVEHGCSRRAIDRPFQCVLGVQTLSSFDQMRGTLRASMMSEVLFL
jgi:hypothetical protein